MWAILDCGTTNTKCYLIKKDGTLLGETYCHFGCSSNVVSDGFSTYSKALRQIVETVIEKTGNDYSKLKAVVAFGMISSDVGLVVVPHLIAPASLTDLRKGVYTYDDSVFGSGVQFLIIRGVRNSLACTRAMENVDLCDFMRGEETQVAGIIKTFNISEPVNIITLGTHFKAIHVDKDCRITRSMTTMSGQLFDCITNNTIVGKSVIHENISEGTLKPSEIAALAHHMLSEYGFGRAVLMPRFMESFTEMDAKDRLTYLDMVLAFDDLESIKSFFKEESLKSKRYFLVGQKSRCENLELAIKTVDETAEVVIIDGCAKNRDISIAGCLEICQDRLQEET